MLFHPKTISTKPASITILCLIYTATQHNTNAAPETDDSSSVASATGQQQQTNWMPMEDSWNYWWSYSGVSGPSYWGLLNPDWFLCHKGRHQSPINIETSRLVYDPHLRPLRADSNLISGVLLNDGHSIVLNCSKAAVHLASLATSKDFSMLNKQESTAANSSSSNSRRRRRELIEDSVVVGPDRFAFVSDNNEEHSPSPQLMMDSISAAATTARMDAADQLLEGAENSIQSDLISQSVDSTQQLQLPEVAKIKFSGAGLAYQYQLETIYFKFGTSSSSSSGSEHQINSKSFAAELQLFAFNSNLYLDFAEASTRPNGLLAISVMITVDQTGQPNEQLERLLSHHLSRLNYRGSWTLIKEVDLGALLSDLGDQFVTYQGSLSQPSCHESVNWLILNRPLRMSQSSLDKLRSLSADEQSMAPSGTLIAGNIRPIQPTNNRPLRTNIKPAFRSSANEDESKGSSETCQRLWTKYEYRERKS